ncbi:MAG TPA: glycoside hydrolase family 5 protein, partial [Gemmataceae bacterium]|nr:glycoside hydrolase family 5 protein [Gemmataceae bacterium]
MLAKLLRSWFAQSPRSRPRSQTPTLEALETRLTPSSTPLHVAGGRLVDASGAAVVLRGVNIAGLESYPTGLDWDANSNSILPQVADEALNSWHANLIRLTLNQDFWFGHDEAVGLGESGDGGAAYQGLVQQIVSEAQASGAYVMLSVWASDMGHATTTNPVAQHDMPDDNTTLFWQSVAARYANNSTVLFDPFNEPHDVTASQWLNGGSIMENGVTYNSPGMQGLLNTIRATGANNIVAPEGLGWATNLSGIDQGFALNDPAGNLMYQFHLYPDDGQSSAAWQADVQPVLNGRYPIYIGEWGTDSDGTDGAGQPSAAAWTQNMLTWLSQNQFSWTAWEFNPPQDGGPNLISDSNYTP